jgi:hypothetical protein
MQLGDLLLRVNAVVLNNGVDLKVVRGIVTGGLTNIISYRIVSLGVSLKQRRTSQ